MADDVSIQLFGADGQLKDSRSDAPPAAPKPFAGSVLIQLFGADGKLKDERKIGNLITTAGDEYYAKRGGAGVSPAAPADVTKVDGMKLGTGATAAAKSGAGAALVTYETGSNNPFDSTYPQFVDLASDTGWQIEYKTTWAAGDVTEAALTEAVMVKDATSDATSSAANTIARVVFAAINKTASDTLVLTWRHTFNAA
jgi:hypothetical protein